MKKQFELDKNQKIIKTHRFSVEKKMELKYVNSNYLKWIFSSEEIKKYIEYSPNNKLSNLKINVKKQLKRKKRYFFCHFS